MYLSHDYQAAFVHIPKTGGTALKKGLLRHLNCIRIGRKHGTVQDLPRECRRYFTFCFVRDPYRRIASLYRFLYLVGDGRLRDRPTMAGMLRNWNPRGRYGPLCQAHFINDRVRIYRYEDFQPSVDDICGRLEKQHIFLPAGEEALDFGPYNWRRLLDAQSVAIINRACRDDFVRFGYQSWTA